MTTIWSDPALRGTGRTTRMLNAAIDAVLDGKRVVIVAKTQAQAEALRFNATELLRQRKLHQRLIGSMKFARIGANLTGYRDLFVDHEAMEALAANAF